MITKAAMFSAKQMEIIEAAESRALEIVSNAYKMSESQWLRNRYDIKTLKDLERKEIVDGPFAQIIRYESKKHPASLGSSVHDVYRICLQDNAILAVAAQYRQIQLLPFSLYIITHELIHIVRFSHYKQGFEIQRRKAGTPPNPRPVARCADSGHGQRAEILLQLASPPGIL